MDPDALRQVVAEAIRNHCQERGLTLHGLADLAGVSQSFMDRVVTRKSAASTDWLAKVAKALEVQPMDLLDPQHLGRARTRAPNPRRKDPGPAE